jgi:carbonic anhydrase/acetyltransferase-like protein (isoleucine patch superfamily)
MINFPINIRPNLVGDFPDVHPTALIDPSAQIIGNVKIGKNVFVAPLAVIRADERGPGGEVTPIIIEEEVNVQDGVIIHSHGGESLIIGRGTTVAHGAIIHGPGVIGEECFLAMRSTLYRATLESNVWVGVGVVIMQASLPAYTYIEAGTIIRTRNDADGLRLVNAKEKQYMENVLTNTNKLREEYRKMRGMAPASQ